MKCGTPLDVPRAPISKPARGRFGLINRRRISNGNSGGHMMYLRPASRAALHQDARAIYAAGE